MAKSGVFTDRMNRFFGSGEGAFTAITDAEIGKQTFNVKAAIKSILINKLGRQNIPRTGVGTDHDMLFHLWPGTEGTNKLGDHRFICKFSKPDKDEMSIYFSNSSLLPKDRLNSEDVWFIFFRPSDTIPWFGFMNKNHWEYYFERDVEHFINGQQISLENFDDYNPNGEETDQMGSISVGSGINIIVYGAPGTGKSHFLHENYKNNTRVVFHPDYTYYDFVGTYKPVPLYKDTDVQIKTMDGQVHKGEPVIDYKFVPGPFTLSLLNAFKYPNTMHTLIIEEINRANASAVFGDIFQLLDRDDSGRSEYSITSDTELIKYLNSELADANTIFTGGKIYIPANLNIVATMNSADQGVSVMDSAFKRRWNFIYMPIKLEGFTHENQLVSYNGGLIEWKNFIRAINTKLSNLKINEDRHIGHYFMKKNEIENPQNIASKLLIYLWDDVVRHRRSDIFIKEIRTYSELVERYISGEKVFNFDVEIHNHNISYITQEEKSALGND